MWLQQTPQGDFVVVVQEGDNIDKAMGIIGASNDQFDIWFRKQVLDVHGIDLSQPLPGPMSVLKVDYSALSVLRVLSNRN